MKPKVSPRFARSGPGKSRLAAILLLAAIGFVTPTAVQASANFPRHEEIAPSVTFWRDVFATYSENQVVIHDDWYLDRIYEVLDFRPYADSDGRLDPTEARMREARVNEAKQTYKDVLVRLHRSGGRTEHLGETERRVAAMFKGIPGKDKYQLAADRVRGQSGLRERFRAGMARQKGYLPAMQAILRQHGVPVELAHLTLVESCFNLEAYSKVGAAGVWQFMPSTGRQYMKVDGSIDERRDPLRSTHAAAEHLSNDYTSLGTWPLAITAYNHGRGGMARAVRTVGTTDFGQIATQYRGPSFGFASRNFYPEFLAALDVVGRSDELLGEVNTVPAPRSREVNLRTSMHLHEAARQLGVSPGSLIAMNPAFLSRVIEGRSAIPRGYRMRVPVSASDVELAMVHAPRQATRKASSAPAKPSYRVHRVQRGQTLQQIARRYGTTVKAIQGLNRVRKPSALQVGQQLRIPKS